MILVSACLLGLNTRYDGGENGHFLLKKYSQKGKFIPICPEQLGGMATPRPPAEIIGATGIQVLRKEAPVKTKEGVDVTELFLQGAREVEHLIELMPIKAAILKERSPSCGVGQIYDGTFANKKIEGMGVTAAILAQKKIPIYSEEDIREELLLELLLD